MTSYDQPVDEESSTRFWLTKPQAINHAVTNPGWVDPVT